MYGSFWDRGHFMKTVRVVTICNNTHEHKNYWDSILPGGSSALCCDNIIYHQLIYKFTIITGKKFPPAINSFLLYPSLISILTIFNCGYEILIPTKVILWMHKCNRGSRNCILVDCNVFIHIIQYTHHHRGPNLMSFNPCICRFKLLVSAQSEFKYASSLSISSFC